MFSCTNSTSCCWSWALSWFRFRAAQWPWPCWPWLCCPWPWLWAVSLLHFSRLPVRLFSLENSFTFPVSLIWQLFFTFAFSFPLGAVVIDVACWSWIWVLSCPTVRRSFRVLVPFSGSLMEEPTASYKALSKLARSWKQNGTFQITRYKKT